MFHSKPFKTFSRWLFQAKGLDWLLFWLRYSRCVSFQDLLLFLQAIISSIIHGPKLSVASFESRNFGWHLRVKSHTRGTRHFLRLRRQFPFFDEKRRLHPEVSPKSMLRHPKDRRLHHHVSQSQDNSSRDLHTSFSTEGGIRCRNRGFPLKEKPCNRRRYHDHSTRSLGSK